jgi:hypothetical protein
MGPHPVSVRTLLCGAVDYAGLFPPAGLSMRAAVAAYARALAGPDAWMLGRLVVPATRLPECGEARAPLAASVTPWPVSAIVRDGATEDHDAVRAFNAAAPAMAAVDTVESKPQAIDGVRWLASTYGRDFDVHVEVPVGDASDAWLAEVKARGLKAKVRTGGLTADAFPTPSSLLTFLDAAVRLGVPFKATAGLHHAVRGSYRLTYEAGSAEAVMYGYLNVLLATSALHAGVRLAEAAALLVEEDGSSLVFTDQAVRWGGVAIPATSLAATRASHLVSFGSCSFREPVDELYQLSTLHFPTAN